MSNPSSLTSNTSAILLHVLQNLSARSAIMQWCVVEEIRELALSVLCDQHRQLLLVGRGTLRLEDAKFLQSISKFPESLTFSTLAQKPLFPGHFQPKTTKIKIHHRAAKFCPDHLHYTLIMYAKYLLGQTAMYRDMGTWLCVIFCEFSSFSADLLCTSIYSSRLSQQWLTSAIWCGIIQSMTPHTRLACPNRTCTGSGSPFVGHVHYRRRTDE